MSFIFPSFPLIFRISNNSYLSANSSRPSTGCENADLQRVRTDRLEGLTSAQESWKEPEKSLLISTLQPHN